MNDVQKQRGALSVDFINFSLGSNVDSRLFKKLEFVQQNFLGFTHGVNVGSEQLQVL